MAASGALQDGRTSHRAGFYLLAKIIRARTDLSSLFFSHLGFPFVLGPSQTRISRGLEYFTPGEASGRSLAFGVWGSRLSKSAANNVRAELED